MPGICGYCKNIKADLNIMMDEYMLTPFVEKKDIYEDEVIHIGQVSLSKLNFKKYEFDNIILFLEGFVYNLEEINTFFNKTYSSVYNMFSEAYNERILDKILNKVNGYYAACLYDKNLKKLFLFTDRFGLRFLYYYHNNGIFAFGSEVKTILAIDEVDKSLDIDAINTYLDTPIGFFAEDTTYFKYIKLIKPSSIIEYDIESDSFNQHYYWQYSEIKQQNISYEKAVDKLHDVLHNAMKIRLKDVDEREIGLSLSGGLDSRLCLALALECKKHPSFAWTMGTKRCLDAHISKIVATKANVKHNHFIMNSNNWFEPRFNAIWNDDGFMNFTDTHGFEFYEQAAKEYTYNLDGYLGDVVLGCSCKGNHTVLDKVIKPEYASDIYGAALDKFIFKDGDYYNTPHFEPQLYTNRFRRYTATGMVNSNDFYDCIIPYFDNDVIEFILSIPDEYRVDNKLYADMLLKYYPDLFKNIPWQRNGLPVSGVIYKNKTYADKIDEIKFLSKKWKNSIKKRIIPSLLFHKKAFADYGQWFYNRKKWLNKFLNSENTVYSNYLDRNLYKEFVEPYINQPKSYGYFNITKAITVECYFRELQKRRYLNN